MAAGRDRDDVVDPEDESEDEYDENMGEAAGSHGACDVPDETESVHIVLLGDSTLDNGRYLNYACGELSVERQLCLRCSERSWDMTALAQDGSLLEDVLVRQIPLIPSHATHIVFSASGNDLLSLLNEMVAANFSLGSMYSAIVEGLKKVAERYQAVLQALQSLGCHLACCTVYRPNFSHLFFKSLAMLSLGLHNSRIQQISTDLDCSLIDLANLFDCHEDFANPLELSTRGGAKVVENVTAFVLDHPVVAMKRYRHHAACAEDDVFLPMMNAFGIPMRCCATRAAQRKIYASRQLSKGRATDRNWATLPGGMRLEFSEAQQRWREP